MSLVDMQSIYEQLRRNNEHTEKLRPIYSDYSQLARQLSETQDLCQALNERPTREELTECELELTVANDIISMQSNTIADLEENLGRSKRRCDELSTIILHLRRRLGNEHR